MAGDNLTCASSRARRRRVLKAKGAYHLRSTQPVTVYQFNPIEYRRAPPPSDNSYSNDASLLFPTTAWRTDHYVTSWNNTGPYLPSMLAVTAMQDATTVTITSKAATTASGRSTCVRGQVHRNL